MMAANPAFDFRHLPIPERLQLVEDIWDSIAQDATAETLPVSEAEKALLDERLSELEANPDAGRPWPQVRQEIIDRFHKRPK
jgi:putative addiction module component (TIGR02574 family)